MKRVSVIVLVCFILVLLLAVAVHAEDAAESGTEDIADIEAEAQNALAVWWSELRQYTPDEWGDYIDEHIMPWISLSVSAIVGIYLAISPILKKIKETSGIFDGASGKLDEAEKIVTEAKKKYEAATGENESLRREFEKVKTGYQKMITSISNIERIVRLGFENSDELITKGYAREIEKIGGAEDDEKAEK